MNRYKKILFIRARDFIFGTGEKLHLSGFSPGWDPIPVYGVMMKKRIFPEKVA